MILGAEMFIDWKGYRFAAWIGQTLLGLAVLAAAVQGKWQNAIVLMKD
jgi:hypothetical protein